MNSYAYPTFPAEAARLHAAQEPSYWPDVASEVDRPEETLADELGTTPAVALKVMAHTEAEVRRSQSLILGRVVGMLLETNNLPVLAHALAFAAGLDQLNGKKSQAQVARELGVTRALVSHYVVGVRDVLSGKRDTFDCTKFRKSTATRKTFKEKATSAFLTAKREAMKRLTQQPNQQPTPCN
jgi:succinate dehydrogenase/fumarate reductase cytochrome b subunit